MHSHRMGRNLIGGLRMTDYTGTKLCLDGGRLGGLDKTPYLDNGSLAFDGPTSMYVRRDALEAYSRAGRLSSGHSRHASGPKKASESKTETKRRSTIRRYGVVNDLTSFVTLSVQGARPPAREVVIASAMRTFRNVKNAVGGAFPCVWVVEGGTGYGGRGHVHALVPPMLAAVVCEKWGSGSTDHQELATAEDIRRKAHYMTKALPFGEGKQVRPAPGFAPERPLCVELDDGCAVKDRLLDYFGEPPCRVEPILSDRTDGWLLGAQMFWDRGAGMM